MGVLLVRGRDDDVPSVGLDLALMEEFGDDDRIRFAGRNRHRPDSIELG